MDKRGDSSSGAGIRRVAEKETPIPAKAVFQLVKDWREFLQDGASKEKELQMATQTGRPAGNKEFVAFLEKLTGRDLSRGKPGWPIKG